MKVIGNHIDINTTGKTLVLPTEDAAILPSFNQSVLNSDRLTIAESPFGGLKGSGSPDYAPGTLYTATDGVNLTDVNGQNSTKTLTAGMLKGVNGLTVDPVAHTITQEFIVANTAESNNPTVVDPCNSTTNWSIAYQTSATLTTDGTQLTVSGTPDGLNRLGILKNFNQSIGQNKFIVIKATANVNCQLLCFVYGDAGLTQYMAWDSSRHRFTANTETTFVLPLFAPQGTSGQNPSSVATGLSSTINRVIIAARGAGITTLNVKTLSIDVAKPCYLELQTPDNLADSSLTLQAWDGSAYQTTGVYKLDSSYSAVSTTTENWKFPDGTKFDDVYGSGLGRALFPKGAAEETKAGSTGSITYSANKGTSKRIGLRVDLPPSDGGRTNFNKIRLKTILSYTDTVGNIVPDLSGNNNTGTIVGGVTKLNDGGLKFDGSTGYIHFGNPLHLQLVQYNDFAVAFRYKHVVGGKKGNLFDHYYFKSTPYSSTLQATFMAYNGTAWFNLYSIVDIYDGNEHFIIYNKSGNTINLYVDGVLRDSQTSDLPFVNGSLTKYLVFGRYNEAASVYTNGSLLSFSVLTRNPTALEIAGEINPADTILTVCPTPLNMGSTTHQFTDSTNTSYGLQNLSKPWIALYDPANSLIDFYLFTHRPQNLSFKRDETGTIYSLSLYPGAGSVYHGQIPFADLTLDTNSDSVPDCLEAAVNGSVTKFLANYSMVI